MKWYQGNPSPRKNISLYQLLTDQQGVQALLNGQHLGVLLLIFTCLGILLACTPCVLPMVPILTSIIVGQTSVSTKKAFFLLFLMFRLKPYLCICRSSGGFSGKLYTGLAANAGDYFYCQSICSSFWHCLFLDGITCNYSPSTKQSAVA